MRKRDANESAIVADLRAIGAEVWLTEDWDLTVAFRGRWHMLEVKTDAAQAKRKSNTAARQQEHRDRAARCGCKIHVVWASEMALEAIGATGRQGTGYPSQPFTDPDAWRQEGPARSYPAGPWNGGKFR